MWTFAKALAQELAARHPSSLTAEYRVAKRPRGRVLVDYNQNAWGRTLASIYSVRPTPRATVSTPVTWEELARVRLEDFTMLNVPDRVAEIGDLWKPLLQSRRRVRLEKHLETLPDRRFASPNRACYPTASSFRWLYRVELKAHVRKSAQEAGQRPTMSH